MRPSLRNKNVRGDFKARDRSSPLGIRRRVSRIAKVLSDPLFEKTALATDSQRRRSRPFHQDRVEVEDWAWKPFTMSRRGRGLPNEGSVMRNPIDIDHKHSRAICQEIGERLQAYLRVEPELPTSLKEQVDQLLQLEGQSPSIVPDVEHRFGNEPSIRGDARGGDQFQFTWPWRRKK
jgi:hypothetical protein